jgi:hypothetical protein
MTRVLFTACALATLAAIGIALGVSLRRSPAVQASGDEPVAARTDEILSVITCCWCKNQTGPCGCKVLCPGHQCRGVGWNEGDFDWAARHGFTLEERRTHQ